MVSVKTVRRIGAAALIAPGLDHLVSPSLTMLFAPTIMQTMFGQGFVAATIFFIVLGLFQLIWIWIILKSNTSLLMVLGVLGNLGSILVYSVSVSGVTIFSVLPQPLLPFAVLIKALEAVFILASVYVLKDARMTGRP